MRVRESEAGQALHTLAMFTCISTSSRLTLCKPLTKPFVCLLYDLYLVKKRSGLSTIKSQRLKVSQWGRSKAYARRIRIIKTRQQAAKYGLCSHWWLLLAFSKPNSVFLIYLSWQWYEWNAAVNASLQLQEADWEVERRPWVLLWFAPSTQSEKVSGSFFLNRQIWRVFCVCRHPVAPPWLLCLHLGRLIIVGDSQRKRHRG